MLWQFRTRKFLQPLGVIQGIREPRVFQKIEDRLLLASVAFVSRHDVFLSRKADDGVVKDF
jgi:hypothetical protein